LELLMGRGDSRRTLKMRRRQAQTKLKLRIKRLIEAGMAKSKKKKK
jgi:hypothetical protein